MLSLDASYFFTLAIPYQFKYLVWGQEPSSLTHRHRRLLTEKRIFSPAYYFTAGTRGNAVKCLIIWAVLWLNCLQTGLFISVYQTAVEIISPTEFANEASHFQYKLWENHDLTVQSVITYIYLCGRIYASCFFLFFKLSFWNRAETELKCNTGITETIYHWHFIIYRQLVLSPF
jgi:hypothetical protein